MDNKKKYEIRFGNIELSDTMNDDAEFVPLIADDEETSQNITIPDTLPILPLRNTVLFPGVVIPITVGRKKSVELIKDAYHGARLIGAISQQDVSIENPEVKDLFGVGTVAHIIKILEMPDDSTSVIIQGKKRFELGEMIEEAPYFKARIHTIEEQEAPKKDKEFDNIVG